jgi:hypothetical protein
MTPGGGDLRHPFHRIQYKLGEGEKEYRLELSGSISNLQRALGEANTRLQLLSAKVGADNVTSEQGSLSVWKCV